MGTAIFIQNKRFVETQFKSEEDFEKVVGEKSKLFFGVRTIFFNMKSKLESKTLGTTIPDGFLFDFRDEENPEFYLVEVELQQHDFYKHVFPQITKFFAFFKNQASKNDLIERLFSFIKSAPEIEQEFKQYLGKKEIYKALKDIIENSQNILLILDGEKPELKEVFETYTDTWDKMVKVEILKQYVSDDGEIAYTLNPDFQEIAFAYQPPPFAEQTTSIEEANIYTESYHLEGVSEKIIRIYENIKTEISRLDPGIKINPQKYYISLRREKNFAYIKPGKTKLRIVIMLPYDVGKDIIKNHKITMLSQAVQDWYGAPCFQVTLEDDKNLDEVIKALKESYTQIKMK